MKNHQYVFISFSFSLLKYALSLFMIFLLIACKSATSPESEENYYKIVFAERMSDGNVEIFAMNSYGSNKVNLTNHPAFDSYPVVSPNGQKIAFESNRDDEHGDIYIMNSDGSGVKNLTNNPELDHHAAFMPDGSSIVFRSINGISIVDTSGTNLRQITNTRNDWILNVSPTGDKIVFDSIVGDWMLDVFIINIDGSERTRLTNNHDSQNPEFLPVTGDKILYESYVDRENTDLFMMNLDGTDKINITNREGFDLSANFSPDGSKIVFHSHLYGEDMYEIFVMNTDGSELIQLTHNTVNDLDPVFSPDGEKVAFLRGDGYPKKIMIINVDGSNEKSVTVDPSNYGTVSFMPLSKQE